MDSASITAGFNIMWSYVQPFFADMTGLALAIGGLTLIYNLVTGK